MLHGRIFVSGPMQCESAKTVFYNTSAAGTSSMPTRDLGTMEIAMFSCLVFNDFLIGVSDFPIDFEWFLFDFLYACLLVCYAFLFACL